MTTSIGSSSIDVTSIVTNLVANKRAAQDTKIANDTSATNTQISALGNFTSQLTALQTAMKTLTDGTAFTTQTANISTDGAKYLSATASTTSVSGSYSIAITQLAAAQKTTSSAFSGGASAKVGTGALTLSVGDKSMTLNLDSSNNTVQNIRDAINKSSSNPGVTATIVTGTDGAHLVLTSASTGVANQFKVTSSGGDGNLAALNFDPATDTPSVAAKDALFSIDGLAASSPSNAISSAIDGLSLTLNAVTDPASPVQVSVTSDQTAAKTAVSNFVTAYNSFVAMYKTLTKYDTVNNQAGALLGDATITTVKSQLASMVGTTLTGSNAVSGIGSLSDIGVSLQVDGTLKLDNTKLTKALNTNSRQVQNLFSGSTGIATNIDKAITGWTGSNGIFATRTLTLNQKIKDLAQQTTDLNTSMTAYSARLTTQYSALDAMMTKLAGTTDYLTQQFASLNKSNS
ncbi:flagellar hook-associated protein 2 [Luteibacter sp. Sphag1AF]|uniref:flagellar filament capping protein FliD n=1 Tax=Luteibacter sp. Sphag1AF TaxID=2587031 RepID=UPI00160FCA19|nr:flagellar filament capping protein FliD [Luteibacter sp. Sphag1AF]MBB3225602.1 flagellar hook-associated protein 2 [Luteibacter sp. Sphag1AF]